MAGEGRQSWLDGALADHAALIRDGRRCFRQLRPDRKRLPRRIAGLEPQIYTLAGAALRHATTQLNRWSVRHPLLFCLSDGKPNDVDHYEGRYGIEDTHQAVHEARMQETDVFCLTIDREAPT